MRMRFRFKRAFTALLLSYFVMLALPSAFTIYLQQQVYRTTERNCVQQTQEALLQGGTQFLETLQSMDNAVIPFAFDADMLSALYMKKPDFGDSRVYQVLRFSNKLDDRLGGIGHTSQGYRLIIRDNEAVFYNGAVTYGLEFYYQKSLSYASMTFQEWQSAVFGRRERFLLPMDDITFNNHFTQSAVTYTYPILRRTPDSGTKEAVVQFFLDRQTIQRMFDGVDKSAAIYLTDGRGALIARLGGDEDAPFSPSASGDENGFYYAANGGGRDLVIRRRVSDELRLAAVLPADAALADANSVRRTSLFALLVYALAESALCVWLARANARPIRAFASDIKTLLPDGAQERSEYAYLEHGITSIRESRESADSALSEKRALERAIFMDRLLDNDYRSADDIDRAARALGMKLEARYCCVAALDCALPEEKMRALCAKFPAPDGMRALFHPYRDGLYALLFLCSGQSVSQNREQIVAHLRALLSALPGHARAGLGKFYESIADAPLSCQQSVFCVQAEEAREDVNIFEHISRTFNAPHFTFKQQQKLTNATKHHEIAVIDDVFDRILLENTQERHLSSALKGVLLSSVEATLLAVAEEMSVEQNLSDLLHAVRREGSFPERLEALRAAFRDISAADAARPVSRNVLLRKQFEEYIASEYTDSGLCVAGAAERFKLSESYFSMMFKELLGEPFSVYLETLRLQKAAALMREGNKTVEEVAAAVGYNNSTTFRRAFKRVNGLSPVQYRSDSIS